MFINRLYFNLVVQSCIEMSSQIFWHFSTDESPVLLIIFNSKIIYTRTWELNTTPNNPNSSKWLNLITYII